MGIQQIAAVVRWNGSAWYLQNDVDHSPIWVSSVSIVQRSYGTRLNIGYGAVSKVGAITLQPDNALLADGYCAGGAEAGLDGTDFELFRDIDIQGQIHWNGTAFAADYAQAAFPVTVENLGGGMCRVHHTPVSFAERVPMLTARNSFYANPKIGMFGAEFFDIQFQVTTPDSSCVCLFKRFGRSSVSPSLGYSNLNGNYWLLGTMLV